METLYTWSADETALDIGHLEALREAKKAFFDRICARSAVQDRHFLAALRQEPTFQMAEFFYLLRAFGVDTTDKMRNLARLHNRNLEALLADRDKMRRLGMTPQRIEKAMFGDDHIDKLAENYARTPATIDQSDIARLLALLMSTETSRRAAVTLDKAGFLERRKSPYQSMLVRSHGTLEDIFGAHIRHIRNAFANAAEKEAVR